MNVVFLLVLTAMVSSPYVYGEAILDDCSHCYPTQGGNCARIDEYCYERFDQDNPYVCSKIASGRIHPNEECKAKGESCTATFVTDKGLKFPNTVGVKIDDNTYVFGKRTEGHLKMVAVDSTGAILTRRWTSHTQRSPVSPWGVTKKRWDGGTNGGVYSVEDLNMACVDIAGDATCQNLQTWCEAAKPDCEQVFVKDQCKKYCGLCPACKNKATWCDAAKPDCDTEIAKENCQKFCRIC